MFSILFPGQGSQQPGMGKFLFYNFQIAKETYQEASEAIKLDLKKLCFDGSEQDLALTANTQPCLLATSIATYRVLNSQFGLTVKAAAGHSIGEYAALVSVGSMAFSPAMEAVRIRGQAMQSAVAVGKGGMLVVLGLEPAQVAELCRFAIKKSGQGPLSPANYNCPGQIVISGNQKSIDWLKENFKPEDLWPESKRVKLIPLQVSAPFHCEMMAPAEEKMREILSSMDFLKAQQPVYQNFTALPVQEAKELRENLIRQVSAPVLWMQSMLALKIGAANKPPADAEPARPIPCVELGAGKVLHGLLKKIDSEAFRVFNTNSLEDLEAIEKFVKDSTQ